MAHEQRTACLPGRADAAGPAGATAASAPPKTRQRLARSKFTRAAALWTSLILGFLILIVLLVFITQNTASAPFTFLGWHWTCRSAWRSCWPRSAAD